MPKLAARQARTIIDAEARCTDAKRELEAAKLHRKEIRERYADRLPLGEWVKAAGYWLKRSTKKTGSRFALGEYLKGHKLTKAMEPFVSNSEYEDWQVKKASD